MSIKSYSPDELYAKFRRIHDAAGPKRFFNSPEHKKTQELWCAAQFGRAFLANLGPCSLLISDQDEQTDADFHLEVAGILHPFQITEVQIPNRRRGDEYRSENVKGATLESWDSGTVQGTVWVREAIQKKYDRYGRSVSELNLLVYVNFPAYEHDYEELCRVAGDSAKEFASVWLLNGNGVCCVSGSKTLGGPYPWLFFPQSEVADDGL